jgi:Ca2+-binding RTX toxin-like protein
MSGTLVADWIVGTTTPDVTMARGGNDRINGCGGSDRLSGGAGRDLLVGGPAGTDSLVGLAPTA